MDKETEAIYRGFAMMIGPSAETTIHPNGTVTRTWLAAPVPHYTIRPLPVDLGQRVLDAIHDVMATKPQDDGGQ